MLVFFGVTVVMKGLFRQVRVDNVHIVKVQLRSVFV